MFKNLLKGGSPFQDIDMRVINRTGDDLAVGEVVRFMLDLDVDGATTAEAKGGGPGVPTGTGSGITTGTVETIPYGVLDAIFGNIDDVAAVGENAIACFAVVTDLLDGSGDDNTEVVVRIQGRVTVNCTSANYNIGDPLQVVSNSNTVAALAAATGQRPIGFSLTEADTQTSIDAMFFGWAGLIGGQHE